VRRFGRMQRSVVLRHLLACLLLVVLTAAPAWAGQPFVLTIAHVNDTHSALESSSKTLTVAGQKVVAQLGGIARIKTALDEVRAQPGNVLVLHAGDAVQGTLFFNMFQGTADFDFLNALNLDAMTLGNHEFDKGAEVLGGLLANATFPIVSANLDASREPALAGRIQPYVIKRFGAEQVGVIGATTASTPHITAIASAVRFGNVAKAVDRAVRELRAQGVGRIVVLSHIGYDKDVLLARSVPGIDVIIGGHSHTLLGDAARLASLGLKSGGSYPTVVPGPQGRTVLVAQAWCWGMQLGLLTVNFDEQGVAGWSARPELLVGDVFTQNGTALPPKSPEYAAVQAGIAASGVARIVPQDADFVRKLAPYAQKLGTFRNEPTGANAAVALVRGTKTDPGPIIADAYLAKVPDAHLSLLMPGGVRHDVFRGEITMGMVMGVLPFGNTLVTLDMTGAEVKSTLEDAVAFSLGAHMVTDAQTGTFYAFHAGGLTCVVDIAQPRGSRVGNIMVRQGARFVPLNPTAVYRLVTNNFLASGKDGAVTLGKAAGRRVDTGHLEHDAFLEYVKRLGVVQPVSPPRVVYHAVPKVGPVSSLRGTSLGLAA